MTIDKLSYTSNAVASQLQQSAHLQDQLFSQSQSHFDNIISVVQSASVDLDTLQLSILTLEKFARNLSSGFSKLKVRATFPSTLSKFTSTNIIFARRRRGATSSPTLTLFLC